MSQYIGKYLCILGALALLLCLSCAPQSSPGNIVDNLGRKVTLIEIPQRIVSLAPSNTEILFALGLGDKVVGITEYCNYPQEVYGTEVYVYPHPVNDLPTTLIVSNKDRKAS